MKPINPTTVWLSPHILLSDLVGCDSVYRHGLANPVYDTDHVKLREGYKLAETLEGYVKDRAVSFTYGYINPRLSEAIVKYQDPRKPSYHRWDKGAACDMIIHTAEEFWANPIPAAPWGEVYHLAWGHYPLDELSLMYSEHGIRWSRAITYAESDVFCFATQISEGDEPRMATYENRFLGGRDIHFNKINEDTIKSGEFEGPDNWRGRGWPHVHGGGRRQYEHVRTGVYTVLSDFLYDSVCAHKGIHNRPPMGRTAGDRFMLNVMLAGILYERIVGYVNHRIPIIAAYVNPGARRTKIDRSYNDHYVLDLKIPDHVDIADVADAARQAEWNQGIQSIKSKRILRFTGFSCEFQNDKQDMRTARLRLEYERRFFLRGIKA